MSNDTTVRSFAMLLRGLEDGQLEGEIPVRLRYRVKDGAVSWFYDMHRAEAAFTHAFDEACARAAKETSLPVFAGTPE